MMLIDNAVARQLAETIEAEWMYSMQAGASGAARAALGMSQLRIGGGVALSLATDPTDGFWNKALGFGVTEPLTIDLVDHVLDFYRLGGASVATLQLADDALPDGWDGLVHRHGLERTNTWAKCLRPLAVPLSEAPTTLRVRRVEPGQLTEWASVLRAGFGMPDDHALIELLATGVANDDRFRPWGAWDGDAMVGAANLFVRDEVAALAGAATLPGARRQGAQSALTRQRLLEARELGATVASFETWAPTGEEHNPSLANMLRIGFEVAYERPNWVWRPRR